MKQLTLISSVIFLFLLNSCSNSIIQIGKVNMISNRNISPNQDYSLIKSYAGITTSELRRTKNETIEEAVDATVKSVPGGEFLMNVKIYQVNKEYFAVEGDVWGNETQEFQGFKIGDKVQWTDLFKTKTGVIVSLVSNIECMVQTEGESTAVRVKYEKLTKVSNPPSSRSVSLR